MATHWQFAAACAVALALLSSAAPATAENQTVVPPGDLRNVPVTHFQAGKDGSGTLSTAEWAMAVDYSGASGADALVVSVGTSQGGRPGKDDTKARQTTLESNGKTFTVLTLSRDGKHPKARLQGNRLVVGKQTIEYAGGKLLIGGFRPQQ